MAVIMMMEDPMTGEAGMARERSGHDRMTMTGEDRGQGAAAVAGEAGHCGVAAAESAAAAEAAAAKTAGVGL